MALDSNILKIREETGAGVMDCKRALDEAGGDIEKAKEIIRAKGLVKAGKREGRETGAGVIEAYVHNNRVGVLMELRSETDFVAKSDPFVKLARELALQLTAMPAETVEEFLEQPYVKDESRKVSELVAEVAATVGENVKIAGFNRRVL